MDHLPVPPEHRLKDLQIPFLSADEYTSPLTDYPKRSGWTLEFRGVRRERIFLGHTVESKASRDLASLLQTWLYFGLLSDFLGEPVDQHKFRTTDRKSGLVRLNSELLETLVQARVADLLQQAKDDGTQVIESFRDQFSQPLHVARNNTLFIVGASTTLKTQETLLLVCLGVCLLGEFLSQATVTLCLEVKIESPTTQEAWRSSCSESDYPFWDCGLPISRAMRRNGWCPHDVARLSGAQIHHVSTLWYIANLDAPRASVVHEDCSVTVCQSMQLSTSQYVQVHTRGSACRCASIGLDEAKVASIIWSGETPVVTLKQNQMLVVEAHSPTVPFIAISHVWSDGKGNTKANTLPICTVRELQRLVDSIPCDNAGSNTAFWIDTLCVPRQPRALKLEALSRLREPYEQASKVLVVDSYLESYLAEGISSFALLSRIAVSGWSHRLWTFQEGRLIPSPGIYFSFQDKAINLDVNIGEWFAGFSHNPPLAANIGMWELLARHSQTQLISVLFPKFLHLTVWDLRSALHIRSTSRAEDEALCIGSILGFPTEVMQTIAGAEDQDQRMAKVWATISPIHTSIIFSMASRKLRTDGFRWAPATFMGSLDISADNWGCQTGGIEASVSPVGVGLEVRECAWTFGNDHSIPVDDWDRLRADQLCDSSEEPSDQDINLCDATGTWFGLRLLGEWHDQPRSLKAGDRAVMLLQLDGDKSFGSDEWRDQDGDGSNFSRKGIIGSCPRTDSMDDHGGIIKLTVHRHISCRVHTPKAQKMLTGLREWTDQVPMDTVTRMREECRNRRGDEDQEERWNKMVAQMIQPYLDTHTDIVESMRSVFHQLLGLKVDSEAALQAQCSFLAGELLWRGSSIFIGKVGGDVIWCVD